MRPRVRVEGEERGEHQVGGTDQAAVEARVGHRDAAHPGRLGSRDPGRRVLDGDAGRWGEAEPAEAAPVDRRVGLPCDLLLCRVVQLEVPRQAERCEDRLDQSGGRGRRERPANPGCLQEAEHLANARERLATLLDELDDARDHGIGHGLLAHAPPGLFGEAALDDLVDPHAHRLPAVRDREQAPERPEDLDLGLLPEGFGVEQDTVHVEHDGLEAWALLDEGSGCMHGSILTGGADGHDQPEAARAPSRRGCTRRARMPSSERRSVGRAVVTISATYGAGGSVVGPAVAARLGVAFVDRAIPVAVAERLQVSLDDAEAHDDRVDTGLARLLARWAPMAAALGSSPVLPGEGLDDEEAYCAQTEAVLRELAVGGAVILGRAGALVLADWPGALHVRLDGPLERRLAYAASRLGISLADAAAAQRKADAARALYVRQLYHADAASPRHYHLVMDSTRLPDEVVVGLVSQAAAELADLPSAAPQAAEPGRAEPKGG